MPEHLTAALTAIGYGVAGTWIGPGGEASLAARTGPDRRSRPARRCRLDCDGWIGGMILPLVQIARMALSLNPDRAAMQEVLVR